MSDVIADSSVVVKWFLPEVDRAQAAQLVVDTTQKGKQLIVLDLALVETTNAIWKQQQRGQATVDEAKQLLHQLQAMQVRREAAEPLLGSALEIAMKFRLSVYDALFVALADQLKLLAVTADEPLYRAVHGQYPNIVWLRHWQSPS